MAIYVWFTIWVFLSLMTAAGVYSLLTKLVKPAWVNWLLLPGTIVSEMAYIFGTLITGGEVRSKIMPSKDGDGGAPKTDATAKFKTAGPIIASALAIAAVGAAIVLVYSALDRPVIRDFTGGDGRSDFVTLSPLDHPDKKMQASATGVANALWDQAHYQVTILRKMTFTLGELHWTKWQIPLFVYLTICLAVRLWPSKRPIRPTLGAVIFLVLAIALTGAIWTRFSDLLKDIWPLLTYVWATLLLTLVVALILNGLVTLYKALAGKGGAPAKAKAA